MATEAEQLVLVTRLFGRTMVVLMGNDFATDLSRERYVVEVDGIAKAEYPNFVKALTASLTVQARASQLSCQTPRCGRRDRALAYVTLAEALQVNRHLPRQWQIASIEALDLIDRRARIFCEIENIHFAVR
jgi:hypothetical protein